MPHTIKPAEEMALVKSSQESIGNLTFIKVSSMYPMKFENPQVNRETMRENVPLKFLLNPRLLQFKTDPKKQEMKEKTLKQPPAIYKPLTIMVGYQSKRGVSYGLNQRFSDPHDSSLLSQTNLGPGAYYNNSTGDLGSRPQIQNKDILRIKQRNSSTDSMPRVASIDISTIKILQSANPNLSLKRAEQPFSKIRLIRRPAKLESKILS